MFENDQNKNERKDAFHYTTWFSKLIIIIMILYCRLMAISQTQEHKRWLALHQRTLQKRCFHMTNVERSKSLYPHHSCIVIRKSTENG